MKVFLKGLLMMVVGSWIGRLGCRSVAIRMVEDVLQDARTHLQKRFSIFPAGTAVLALRNLSLFYLYPIINERAAETRVLELVELLERIAEELPDETDEFSRLMKPTLTLLPVMCSFTYLPHKEAEELLGRWAALDQIVRGPDSFSKVELMEVFAEQLESTEFEQLHTNLKRCIRKAYCGHEFRIR